MKATIISMGLFGAAIVLGLFGRQEAALICLVTGWVVVALDGSGPRPPKAYA